MWELGLNPAFSFISDPLPTKPCIETDVEDATPFSVLQESNLTQEIALIVLETVQALAQHVSVSFFLNIWLLL